MRRKLLDPKTLIQELNQDSEAPNSPDHDVLNKISESLQEIDVKALINKGVEGKRKKILLLEAELNQTETDEDRTTIQRQMDLLTDEISKTKIYQYQLLVHCVEQVIKKTNALGFGICHFQDGVYIFNGSFWRLTEKESIKQFLGQSAEKLGIEREKSKYFQFKESLYEQLKSSVSQMILPSANAHVSINLQNGTFDIKATKRQLRGFDKSDFLRYQLPFSYEPSAKAPMFHSFLDKVLPDKDCQKILSEYLGYVFIRGNALKLEKVLLLYGSGANGKSVVFDVVRSLVGDENISHYSLQSLCDQTGHNRANLANKLVNYSSELNGDLSADKFKQLASGEPIEARQLYSAPFILKDYGKLVFNCNELPWRVEHTHGFFRRFLILPFEVTIPKTEQDKHLADKIIKNELPGVFNWVMEGLKRLLYQNEFTDSDITSQVLNQFKAESDTVQLFLEDMSLRPSSEQHESARGVYNDYRSFCAQDGYQPLNHKNFKNRMKSLAFVFVRTNSGWVVYMEKKELF